MSFYRRAKQVFRAVTASVSEDDRIFVARFLNKKEETLFWRMDTAHQYHSLNVAYTSVDLLKKAAREDFGDFIDENLLIRAALLHDIAKKDGTVTTLDKIICVLLDKILPKLAKKIAAKGGGEKHSFKNAVYLYYNHAAIGAAELKKCGLEREAAIVACHHQPYTDGEAAELTILRQADDLN